MSLSGELGGGAGTRRDDGNLVLEFLARDGIERPEWFVHEQQGHTLIHKVVRRAHSRIRQGLRDGRIWALYDAVLRRLATKDYEQISISELARGAGCSVGAFYSRFRDKDLFLRMVTVSAFRALTDDAKRELDPNKWRGAFNTKST